MRTSFALGRSLTVALLAAAFATLPSATAQAGTITYTAVLNGANEAPPNASPGTGFATVVYDDIAHTLLVNATFQDLIGTTTAAHIHAATAVPGTGTAGVATTTPTFAGFPLGVTSGTYLNTLDLTLASSWNPATSPTTAGQRPVPRRPSLLRWRAASRTSTSTRRPSAAARFEGFLPCLSPVRPSCCSASASPVWPSDAEPGDNASAGLWVAAALSICAQGGQAKVTRAQMETARTGPAARRTLSSVLLERFADQREHLVNLLRHARREDLRSLHGDEHRVFDSAREAASTRPRRSARPRSPCPAGRPCCRRPRRARSCPRSGPRSNRPGTRASCRRPRRSRESALAWRRPSSPR